MGDKFEPLGKGVAGALGIPDLRYVTTPHPINRFSDDEVAGLAAERYADVVRAVTRPAGA
jgi:hypothetical protein